MPNYQGNMAALETARKNLAAKRADGNLKAKPRTKRAPADVLLVELRRKVTEAIAAPEPSKKRAALVEAQNLIGAILMLIPAAAS